MKGDGSTRSRLVARDFKGLDRHRDDLFAAAPPLEAARAVLSMAATKSSNGPVKKVMMIEAKKAHFARRTSTSSCHQKSGQSRVSVASSISGCTDSARRRGETSMLRLWRRQVFEEELGAR